MPFTHDRLDVYKAALKFGAVAAAIVEELPRGHSHLADQLRRASSSVTLNIAEGAGEFRTREKARIYRIARRSATECAAIIDLIGSIEPGSGERLREGRGLLDRIAAMLTRLVLVWERTDSEAGARTSGAASVPRAADPDPDPDPEAD